MLTVEQKATLATMREKKQVSRYLLPDAPPPKKQKRKASPSRLPCPLLPGVPVTPPHRKQQAWEKQSLPELGRGEGQAASGPWRVDDSDPEPPLSIEVVNDTVPQMFSPSTGILRRESLDPDHQIVERMIEFVKSEGLARFFYYLLGFTPTSSRSLPPVECSTPEWLEPTIFDASGSSHPGVERATPSPEWLEPSIFDDDAFLGLQSGADPGSDVEEPDEVIDAEAAEQRHLLGRTEDIPASLARILAENDNRDDIALREAVSNPDMLHFDWSNDPELWVSRRFSLGTVDQRSAWTG